MNSIWNKNYRAFKARFPQLAEMLPAVDINIIAHPSFWDMTTAKNGMITCSENGLRLHSGYNPEREAASGISSREIEEKTSTVFYGFGLGYHVIQWAKKFADNTEKKLILIEPDYKHFFAALSFLDWSDVFKIKNLILAVSCPPEDVLPLIEDTSTVNVGNSGVSDAYFFSIPAFMVHEQEYFNAVQEIIKRNKKKNDINAATLKKFGKLWCRNSMKNICQMKKLLSVNDFNFHSYIKSDCNDSLTNKTMPFLIIGAGPSLEKLLPYMKELKKRTVIICVETALRALLRAGVQPDFIIITDPQFWAYRHIAGLEAPESILVTEISAYPAVFRFPCKKIILCSSQFPIGQYFQMKMKIEPGDLGTGGSVASSAWNLAYFWGAKEIFTAGLDFAFPDNKTHIKGSEAEEAYLTISNKVRPLDNFALSGLFNANAQQGTDYNGNTVITDSRMKMFSWWFESRLVKCPNTKTYTLCPEGLKTPGIEIGNLKNLLEYDDISMEKKEIFDNSDNKNTLVHGDKLPIFKKLIRDFPNDDFINKFPFLKEYL